MITEIQEKTYTEHKDDVEWILSEVLKSIETNGYERFVIVFDKGKIVHAVKETPIKPPSHFKKT